MLVSPRSRAALSLVGVAEVGQHCCTLMMSSSNPSQTPLPLVLEVITLHVRRILYYLYHLLFSFDVTDNRWWNKL